MQLALSKVRYSHLLTILLLRWFGRTQPSVPTTCTGRGSMRLRSSYCWIAALLCITCSAFAQDMGSNTPLVNAAKGICGGTGVATDVSIDGAGNVTIPLSKAGLTGAVHYSKTQWDGIKAMQGDAARYVECIKFVLPTLKNN